MTRWLSSAVAWLAACGFTPDYGGTAFQCPDGETCPPGFDCVEGVCVGPADAGDPAGTDDPEDDGEAPGDEVPCGASIAAIDDDFRDGEVGALWTVYTSGDAAYDEDGGEASFTVEPGGEVGLATGCGHDATGATIAIDDLNHDVDDAAVAFLRLTATPNRVASLSVGGGGVVLEVRAPGSTESQSLLAADDDDHYRIREQDGTLAFDASTDGATWRTLAEIPATFAVDDVQVSLGARSLGGDTTIEIEIDRVRGGP